MLQFLHIKNLALMEEASLEFEDGFIAVTGETGAGKSVLLGALSLLSGARADRSVIRQGANTCELEAALCLADSEEIDRYLDELGLPRCVDGALLLRRVVGRKRMARAQINGSLTTLANLRNLGEYWIDFHGPGEPQKLFKERWQCLLLDCYAGLKDALADYREGFRKWVRWRAEVDSLRAGERLSEDEQAFIRSQIGLIDAAEVTEAGISELERDYNRLNRAQDLGSLVSSIESGLRGTDSATDKLSSLLVQARELAAMDEEAVAMADRLESMIIELEDLGADYRGLMDGLDADQEHLDRLQERVDLWYEVKRKFGPEVGHVLEKRASLERRLASQGDVEGAIARRERDLAALHGELDKQAEVIRRKRVKEAAAFSRQAEKLINALGFKKARLQIEVLREPALTEHGNSKVRMLFAPNPGLDLRPLKHIASSGEIARVMLALKAVLARVDATPLLVFDEVDANVGGEIAHTVGRELKMLGNHHQVICVTHLPQVAARGQSHFLVSKRQGTTSTSIAITPLHESKADRVEELARMLGDRSSAPARQHAEELLRR